MISPVILIRGAGEMASAIAHRLYGAGLRRICLTDIAHPLAVRRSVSFCPAIETGQALVEGVEAGFVEGASDLHAAWKEARLGVALAETWNAKPFLVPDVVIDAILAKRNLGTRIDDAPLVIALGPGFVAGVDAHAIIETNRGHDLGRILRSGSAAANTGIPGSIAGFTSERVLRAPAGGIFTARHEIGDIVTANTQIGTVEDVPVMSGIDGVLRGLIRPGTFVTRGLKIGDIDPRGNRIDCHTISDKARAIAGSVLEAVLHHANL